MSCRHSPSLQPSHHPEDEHNQHAHGKHERPGCQRQDHPHPPKTELLEADGFFLVAQRLLIIHIVLPLQIPYLLQNPDYRLIVHQASPELTTIAGRSRPALGAILLRQADRQFIGGGSSPKWAKYVPCRTSESVPGPRRCMLQPGANPPNSVANATSF